MKVIKVSQENDRQTWLELRRGVITGSKAKGIKPLSRGTDKTPQGFWQLLAEKISIEPDGENVMDRGLRLENEALRKTAKQFKLNLNYDPGMWLSDIDDDIAVSPDAAEDVDSPTYAVEAKCFDSANHLKYIIIDKKLRESETYSPFTSIPPDNRDQVVQYFLVNEKLETLYFTFYDDRIAIDKHTHHVIIVKRKDVEGEIEVAKDIQTRMLDKVNELIGELNE